MSECLEHVGKYNQRASCLICLAAYWESAYKLASARADALNIKINKALLLIEKWKHGKHPQNNDWDTGWDHAELNCAEELQQALEDKPNE